MATPTQSAPTFSAGRRWLNAFNLVIGTLALVAIVLMLNVAASRHYLRLQWSARNRVELSPQTLRVLDSITNEIRATLFFDTRSEPELLSLLTAVLKEFNYANPRILYKIVDPVRQPTDAELVLAKYKLSALKDKNFVVFDSGARTKVIYENELADYSYERVNGGQPNDVRKVLVAFNGETAFANAVFNLANPTEARVYFLQDHGEHDPERESHPHGYARFAGVLRESGNVHWDKLSLRGTNEIPADCRALIIAGPRLPLEEAELKKIDQYLRNGGRLFALLNNMRRFHLHTGLEKVLAQWGIGVLDVTVFDVPNSRTEGDLLVGEMNVGHPIMKALAAEGDEMRVRLVLPRIVGQLRAVANSPNPPKFAVLAQTGPSATAATDIREGVAYPNPSDQRGIFPLMIAVEQGKVPGVSTERGNTRIVVVGDSLFVDNEMIEWLPNRYFTSLAINWLLDRPQVALEGIVPLKLKSYKLIVTRSENRTLRWLFLCLMPGSVLLLGVPARVVEEEEMKNSSNIEHRTSNIERPMGQHGHGVRVGSSMFVVPHSVFDVRCSKFNVQCSMFRPQMRRLT